MAYEAVKHNIHVAYAKTDLNADPQEVSDFFDNSNPENCPITSCELLKNGCVDANPEDSLKIDPTDFQITSTVNKANGYNQNLCIKCTNGDDNYPRQTLSYDNFRVTLPNQCIGAFNVKSTYDKSIGVMYQSPESAQYLDVVPNVVEEFFKNDDSDNCPV